MLNREQGTVQRRSQWTRNHIKRKQFATLHRQQRSREDVCEATMRTVPSFHYTEWSIQMAQSKNPVNLQAGVLFKGMPTRCQLLTKTGG